MVFVEILKTICAFFDWLIYSLVVNCYVLFAAMCEMNVESIGKQFVLLTGRLKVFFGIIMLFIVAFNLLKMLVDPDKAEGEASKLVQKIAISIVLLISMNFIFGLFNELQNIVIKDNVIESIIFGQADETYNVVYTDENGKVIESTGNYKEYVETGKFFSYNLLFAFINVPDDFKKEVMGSATKAPSKTLFDVVGEINEGEVYYRYPVISGICGIFMGVIFVTYAIEVGIRAFSLMLLQVIAPVPIIAYITPNGKGILEKYFKEYISTFVSLFIKIFIIFITLYLMQFAMKAILPTLEGEATDVLFPNMAEAGNFFKALLLVAVIFSLFYFSKKFTKMIESIFGIKIDSDLNPFKAAGGIVKGAIGGAIGGFVGGAAAIGTGAGLMGGLGAVAKGLGSGASSGAKAKNIKDFVGGSVGKNFTSVRKGSIDLGNKGGVGGSIAQGLNTFNQRRAAVASTNLATINKGEELRSAVNSEADKISLKALGYDDRGSYIDNALNTDARYNNAQAALELERNSAANGRSDAQREADLASKMSAVQVEKQRATKDATTYLDSERDSIRNRDIAAKTGPVYAKAVEYQSHATQNSGLYKGHTPLDKSGAFTDDLHNNLNSGAGIKTGQQQIINSTSSNGVAKGAGAAQSRGAVNAAKHSGGKK